MVEQARDDVQAAVRRGPARIPPVAVAVTVVVLCLVTGVLVFLLTGSRRQRIMTEGNRPTYQSEWLDIPVMEIKDIALSVPLEASGAQRKQLTVGVAVRFAPAEGRSWSGGLPRDVARRLGNLRPEFRHIVIGEISSRTYAQLSGTEGLNQVLQELRRRFEERIQKCDLGKDIRVHEVMWGDLFWG
jgi:hypothetical protein